MASLSEGLLARRQGRLTDAGRHYARALRMLGTPENRDWAAAALTGQGFVADLSGDLDAAEDHHRQAWQIAIQAGPVGTGIAALAVEGLACVAAARADAPTTAALLAAASRWRADHRRPASPTEQADIDRAGKHARDLLGSETYEGIIAAAAADPHDLLTAPPTPRNRGPADTLMRRRSADLLLDVSSPGRGHPTVTGEDEPQLTNFRRSVTSAC